MPTKSLSIPNTIFKELEEMAEALNITVQEYIRQVLKEHVTSNG